MDRYQAQLDWIDRQGPRMAQLVAQWSQINSHTRNLAGLVAMARAAQEAFTPLGSPIAELDLPPHQVIDHAGNSVEVAAGPALNIRKTGPSGTPRVLLGIHLDTVYPVESPMGSVEFVDDRILRGPGVADAKGGLAVMLVALEALERSPLAGRIGWEVLLNPDEEIGSPSSAGVLAQCAARNDLGLVFEPALDEQGALAGARRGSGSFTIVIRGKAAHSGRDFAQGRSAIVPLAEVTLALHALNDSDSGITVNVGQVAGGTGRNVVPDLSICRFNVRITEPGQGPVIEQRVREILEQIGHRDGIRAELTGSFHCPPKPLDPVTAQLFEHVAGCGRELGLAITWKPTGGVCDGNKLAAAGLPTVDSLGVRGGGIHSPEEYLLLPSLTERAKLTALLLMKLASGELPWDGRRV